MSSDAAAHAWAESLAPVTAAMLELARPAAGERVIDLGAGAGHLALEIAARVGTTGTVLAVEPSPEGVAAIERRAAEVRDGAPVRALAASAESLDVGAAQFDLVVARNSLMYFDDLPRALDNVLRALRPGGRFVASVYPSLDAEPFHAIPLAAVTRRTRLARPLPAYAAAFELSTEPLLAALRDRGFGALTRTDVPVRRSYPSLPALQASLRASGSLAELMARLAPADRDEAWAEIDRGFARYSSGTSVVVPGRQAVIVAIA